MSVLSSRLAGHWYPNSVKELQRKWQTKVRKSKTFPLWAMAPHAGWPYSLKGQSSVISQLDPGNTKVLVLLSPSHYFSLEKNRIYTSEYSHWKGVLGANDLLDPSILSQKYPHRFQTQDRIFPKEHGLEMLLPGIQLHFGTGLKILPLICASMTDRSAITDLVGRLLEFLGPELDRTSWLVSSDLTHYGPRFGYQPFGQITSSVHLKIREYDGAFLRGVLMGGRDFVADFIEEKKNTICGISSILIMMEVLEQLNHPSGGAILCHYDSGDFGSLDKNLVAYGGVCGEG